jgi:GDP-mannose 6-dehydrogenase
MAGLGGIVMNVSVFGLGYVGCVTAACLAQNGHRVIGVDVSSDKVDAIKERRSPIVEPGLAELIAAVVESGHLAATRVADDALSASDIALICVGTPDLGHGQQDLEALARVSSAIGRAARTRTTPLTVVVRSTVLPGTTAKLLARMRSAQDGAAAPIHVAMNPEFMREGSSLHDFDHPPFVLVGTESSESAAQMRQLYAGVDAPFIHTTVETAEMVKYVCNAYHALKICFANEIADVCTSLGADAHEVMRVFQRDHKLNISPAYLTPGFAFGGSCLPKDIRALLCAGRMADIPLPLLAAIMPSNDGQISQGIDAVLRTRKKRIGVVGLAFKPDTDDLRDSPMVTMVEALIGKGYDVRIYDPNVVMARLKGANRRYIETEIPHIAALLAEDLDQLLSHAEVLVFSAAGREASRVLAAATPEHVIVDLTRGLIAPPRPATVIDKPLESFAVVRRSHGQAGRTLGIEE